MIFSVCIKQRFQNFRSLDLFRPAWSYFTIFRMVFRSRWWIEGIHYKKVEIIEGAVCKDHVHLCVSIPPKICLSDFMGYLKGKSALMIHDRHPEMENKWNREFWARAYYVSTIGNINEETIRKYISEQEEESKKEDTRI